MLAATPRGRPFKPTDVGISRQLASYYAANGWLVRLGQGVYSLPGDDLNRDGAVGFLQAQVDGLHIAGKSALSLHGVRHYLAIQEVLVLWGDHRFALPSWFTTRFPARYAFTHLFDWANPSLARRTVGTPPGIADGLRVSCPERAALELLHDVGRHESLTEARDIFDGLRNLRRDLLGELLSSCRSVKAVRLFLTWARETELVDVDDLRRRFPLRVGSSARWMNRLPDGTLLTLKPYG